MPRQIVFTPYAAKPPATYSQAVKAAVLLDDLVADPDQRTSNIVGGHDLTGGHGMKD